MLADRKKRAAKVKKKEITVKRCTECANNCPLTEPKCITGQELAESGGIYEESDRVSGGRLKQWIELKKFKKDYF